MLSDPGAGAEAWPAWRNDLARHGCEPCLAPKLAGTMPTVIAAQHIVTGSQVLSPGAVCVDEGRITAVSATIPPGSQVLPGHLVPGFVDIHAHSAGGATVVGADRATVATVTETHLAQIAAAGGIDLQILGIGADGHLAFNMPMSSLASRTRLKTLTRKTREDDARFFDGDMSQVRQHCLTQGLGTIMEARHAVMLGFGENKAQAVAECVEGPVAARWPASILQMHRHATVVVDEGAASQLRFTGYYIDTFDGKPAWQGL